MNFLANTLLRRIAVDSGGGCTSSKRVKASSRDTYLGSKPIITDVKSNRNRLLDQASQFLETIFRIAPFFWPRVCIPRVVPSGCRAA